MRAVAPPEVAPSVVARDLAWLSFYKTYTETVSMWLGLTTSAFSRHPPSIASPRDATL